MRETGADEQVHNKITRLIRRRRRLYDLSHDTAAHRRADGHGGHIVPLRGHRAPNNLKVVQSARRPMNPEQPWILQWRSPVSLEKYCTLASTWPSLRAGSSAVLSLKVASGPDKTGAPDGLDARIHCLVEVGAMFVERGFVESDHDQLDSWSRKLSSAVYISTWYILGPGLVEMPRCCAVCYPRSPPLMPRLHARGPAEHIENGKVLVIPESSICYR